MSANRITQTVARAVRGHLQSDSKHAPLPPIEAILGALGPDSDILYHYTTGAGLAGIIGDNYVRATDARFLNDATELDHGIELVHDAFTEFRAQTKDATRKKILRGLDVRRLMKFARIFTFCLSSKPDQLSQWRGYTGEGHGYAIGFKKLGLSELFTENGEQSVLVRMDYSGEASMAYVEGILMGHEELENQTGTKYSMRSTNRLIANTLIAESLKFKNRAFWEEGEWRLIAVAPEDGLPPIRFFPRRNTLAPYVTLRSKPERRLPITRVLVGPGSYAELAQGAVVDLLKSNGYSLEEVSIDRSEIPYRTT